MTVCDITQFWSPVSGGVRRYVAEKVAFLRGRGGRHVLIVPGERDEVGGDDAARVYTVASPGVSRTTGYRVLLRLGEIGRILAAEMPHIVESGDPYQVGWRVARDCARLAIPCVAFYHSHFAESELRPLGGAWLAGLARPYCRALYNRFARTLVPSPEIAGTLSDWGVANTTAVDLGVDTRKFVPAVRAKQEARAELGLPRDSPVLLYVGRLAAEKGTRVLCDAFARLRAAGSSAHLVVTGEGLQRGLVERLAADTRAVTFLPFATGHADLLRLYHAADLFVHPGVQETFGLVTAEAQACGLPVVGFRGTAMDRVVCHSQSFWAGERTAESLADAIGAALALDLPALGDEGRRGVEARFSWENVFARQFDVYAGVMHNARRQ
jgi:alpha-1,6-mannosyltransferase